VEQSLADPERDVNTFLFGLGREPGGSIPQQFISARKKQKRGQSRQVPVYR